jgi:phenylacetyl-CoA:acceptor oxidoreductase subunit 2
VNWLQKHWDTRAALNFMLGGMGAGLMVASTLLDPASDVAVALALALVAAGLGAVWLEIGKRLRALHVFLNPFTSWMTRESFVAVVYFGLGLAALRAPQPWLWLAAPAGLAFVFCQGRILRASKGIPAWRAPQVVPLIVATGLAEGAGLAMFFGATPPLVTWFALVLLLRTVAWVRYDAATRSPVLVSVGKVFVQVGAVGGLLMALVAYWQPDAGLLAGLLAIVTGQWLKFALVTRASVNQGYSLPRLHVRGSR